MFGIFPLNNLTKNLRQEQRTWLNSKKKKKAPEVWKEIWNVFVIPKFSFLVNLV